MSAGKILFTIILLCLIPMALLAENDALSVGFVEKVQGAGLVAAAVQTRDGGYVTLSDFTASSGIVRKISSTGRRIWERTLSVQVSFDGFAFLSAIAETKDGFVVAGWGRLTGYYSNESGIIVNLGKKGAVQSTKTFEGTSFDYVFPTSDGGYIVHGNTYQPLRTTLLKFSSSHNLQWSKGFEIASHADSQPVSDGTVLATAVDPSEETSTDRIVVKVNDSGQLVWKQLIQIKDFSLHRLGPASGNGVVLAGKSKSSSRLILIELNANGQIHRKSAYSMNAPSFAVSNVKQRADGGYVITGSRLGDPAIFGNRAGFVLGIDAQRNILFQKMFGREGVEEDGGFIFETEDDGLVLFGSSGSEDMLILNLNSKGIVPGCRFLRKLRVDRVASPKVSTKNVEVALENVSLPAPGSIGIDSVRSKKASSDECLP